LASRGRSTDLRDKEEGPSADPQSSFKKQGLERLRLQDGKHLDEQQEVERPRIWSHASGKFRDLLDHLL
jgi:hypothetical protein